MRLSRRLKFCNHKWIVEFRTTYNKTITRDYLLCIHCKLRTRTETTPDPPSQ